MTETAKVVNLRERKYKTSTGDALLTHEFAPVKWAIPDVLAEGVTLFGGREKMGKSWMALGACIAVATGGYVLGKIPVEQGTALYLSLEDNERRLQRRLRKLIEPQTDVSKLQYATEWGGTDDGGIEQIEEFLTDYPDTRLVVVDTLKRVRPRTSGRRNMYDVDYEAIQPFVPVAAEYNVAIVLVHHLNQDANPNDPYDSFQGSAGLPAAAEGILLLTRERGQSDAVLTVDGKDIRDRQQLALQWGAEACTWTAEGDAEQFRMSKERREIVEAYEENKVPALTPKLVASLLDKDYNSVKQLMYKMGNDDQLVSNNDGSYSLPR